MCFGGIHSCYYHCGDLGCDDVVGYAVGDERAVVGFGDEVEHVDVYGGKIDAVLMAIV